MKGILATITLLMVLSIPAPLFGKGPTSKVTIKGADLTAPIEITDPKILANFPVWAGPGTNSSRGSGAHVDPYWLIVDWSQGIVPEPPRGLPSYEVSFYTKHADERLVYVVSYVYDPSSGHGFVYLPGKGEDWYRLNVGTILRRIEGNWFRAWSVWENIARPLIATAK